MIKLIQISLLTVLFSFVALLASQIWFQLFEEMAFHKLTLVLGALFAVCLGALVVALYVSEIKSLKKLAE